MNGVGDPPAGTFAVDPQAGTFLHQDTYTDFELQEYQSQNNYSYSPGNIYRTNTNFLERYAGEGWELYNLDYRLDIIYWFYPLQNLAEGISTPADGFFNNHVFLKEEKSMQFDKITGTCHAFFEEGQTQDGQSVEAKVLKNTYNNLLIEYTDASGEKFTIEFLSGHVYDIKTGFSVSSNDFAFGDIKNVEKYRWYAGVDDNCGPYWWE